MQKQVTQNSHTATTQYMGGYQYSNTRLQFFPTAEGYVKNTIIQGQNSYDYVYNLTDHLGNIRMSFGLDPKTQQLVKFEENNYYPYGLKHTNYNADINAYIAQGTTVVIGKIPISSPLIPINAYKYNGKELQEELSLNIYDMDFRDYDPATARWLGVDPITHFSQSPYNAFDSNPVLFADPSGLSIIYGMAGQFADSDKNKRGHDTFGRSVANTDIDSIMRQKLNGGGSVADGINTIISIHGNTININWSAFGDTRTVWNASTNIISTWIPGPGGVIYDGDPSVNRLDSAVVNGHWERSGGWDKAFSVIGGGIGGFTDALSMQAEKASLNYMARYGNAFESAADITISNRMYYASLGKSVGRLATGISVVTTAYSGYNVYNQYQTGGIANVSGLDVADTTVGVIGLGTTALATFGLISNPVGWAIGTGILIYGGIRLVQDLNNP